MAEKLRSHGLATTLRYNFDIRFVLSDAGSERGSLPIVSWFSFDLLEVWTCLCFILNYQVNSLSLGSPLITVRLVLQILFL